MVNHCAKKKLKENLEKKGSGNIVQFFASEDHALGSHPLPLGQLG